jgi:hypothetical protein
MFPRQVGGLRHTHQRRAAVGRPAVVARMDAVIDRIVEVPEVMATDSKVARWTE